MKFDQTVAIYLRRHLGKAPRVWNWLARYAMYVYVVAVFASLALISVSNWLAHLLFPALACYVATLLVQMVIRRPRPNALPHGFKLWIHTYSFPSAHSSASFACAVLLSALAFAVLPTSLGLAPVVLIMSFALAILIALSRIIVGVHYPSDVIAGSLLGTVLAGIFVLFL